MSKDAEGKWFKPVALALRDAVLDPGLAAGLYPFARAAGLTPVEALAVDM